MSQQQNSWDDLLQNWNANDVGIDKQIPPEEVLIDQIKKQNRNNKIEVIFSIIVSIALASYIISEMYSGLPSIADTILYSVFLVLVVSVVLYAFVSTKRSIAASTDNTLSHIMVLLEQSKSNLKTLLFSRIICATGLLISLLLLSIIAYVALHKALEFKHYLVGGTALGCSLLFVGLFIWFKKQRVQLEERIEFLTSHEN
jgi:hypothetical protein